MCLYDSPNLFEVFFQITTLLLIHGCCVVTCRKPQVCCCVCAAAHLQLLLSLQGELFKRLDDDSRVGAVVDENGRAPHPSLQVVDGQRDVLGIVLRERKRERGDV